MFASLHLLEWLYLALFSAGLVYALFLAFFGLGHGFDHGDVDLGHGFEHGGLDLGHHGFEGGAMDVHVDAHLDHAGAEIHHGAATEGHGHHVSPLSPVIIATFLGGFGGFGLLATRLFGLPLVLSPLVALPAGALLAGGMFLLYARVFAARDADSTISWLDIRGAVAEVVTPIPEGGLGEIVYVARGTRHSCPARSITGWAIPKGTRVTILRMVNGVAVVDLRYVE